MTQLVDPNTYVKVMQALDRISQGVTATAACDELRLPTLAFKRAIENDDLLASLAADAFDRGYDTMADILLNIDNNVMYGSNDPKVMKVKSDNIKWYLTKKAPGKFGEKIVVENRFTADKAITEALERGKQRALQSVHAEVIDVVAVDITPAVADGIERFYT